MLWDIPRSVIEFVIVLTLGLELYHVSFYIGSKDIRISKRGSLMDLPYLGSGRDFHNFGVLIPPGPAFTS